MQFLNFLIYPKKRQSQNQSLMTLRLLVAPSSRMLSVPAQATITVGEKHSPLVKYAGTFWRFKLYGFCPPVFLDGQSVKILGLQGNCLLIEMEKCDDK